MSTRSGNQKKTGQKYQNKYAFQHNKNSKLTKHILALPVDGLCFRCKDIIDWKKRFRKYKPLTQPKKCVGCAQKTVKKAYHQLCDPCAAERGVCAKCMVRSDIAPKEGMTAKESYEEEQQFRLMLQSLRERERRKVLRDAAKLRAEEGNAENDDDDSDDDEGSSSSSSSSSSKAKTKKNYPVREDGRDQIDDDLDEILAMDAQDKATKTKAKQSAATPANKGKAPSPSSKKGKMGDEDDDDDDEDEDDEGGDSDDDDDDDDFTPEEIAYARALVERKKQRQGLTNAAKNSTTTATTTTTTTTSTSTSTPSTTTATTPSTPSTPVEVKPEQKSAEASCAEERKDSDAKRTD